MEEKIVFDVMENGLDDVIDVVPDVTENVTELIEVAKPSRIGTLGKAAGIAVAGILVYEGGKWVFKKVAPRFKNWWNGITNRGKENEIDEDENVIVMTPDEVK